VPASGPPAGRAPNGRSSEALMVARVNTVAFLGMDVITVDVQVQMASGLPAFTKVCQVTP